MGGGFSSPASSSFVESSAPRSVVSLTVVVGRVNYINWHESMCLVFLFDVFYTVIYTKIFGSIAITYHGEEMESREEGKEN